MKMVRQEVVFEIRTFAERMGSGAYAHFPLVEVSDRNPKALGDIANYVSAVCFFDVVTTRFGQTSLSSTRENPSGMHYFGGTVFTREEVTQLKEADKLLKAMDKYKCGHLIKDRNGCYQPFYPERDEVLEPQPIASLI